MITTIAEIGQAHDGSLEKLHSYIDAVATTGVEAIKFQTHIAEAESSIDAEVISATEVSNDQLTKIAAALKTRLGKKVRLTSKVDPTLIGGAVIRAGDMVIDGSVSGQLTKLSTALMN